MRKAAKCSAIIFLIIFIFAWGIMGIKILDNNYLVTTEAYIGLISFITFWGCGKKSD